jgi:hypothetical protein
MKLPDILILSAWHAGRHLGGDDVEIRGFASSAYLEGAPVGGAVLPTRGQDERASLCV